MNDFMDKVRQIFTASQAGHVLQNIGGQLFNSLPPVQAYNFAQQAAPTVQHNIQQAIPQIQAIAGHLSQEAQQVYNQLPPLVRNQIPTSLPQATYQTARSFMPPAFDIANSVTNGGFQNFYQDAVKGTVDPFIGAGASILHQPKLNLPFIGSAPNLQTQQQQGTDFLQKIGLPKQVASPISTAGLAMNFLPLGELGTAKAPATEKAVLFLRNKLTSEDVNVIGKFAEIVESKGGRAAIEDPELNNRIHSLATNVFGGEAENWTNQKIKNVFDLVLQKIGTQPNRAGLGLSINDLRQSTSPELQNLTGAGNVNIVKRTNGEGYVVTLKNELGMTIEQKKQAVADAIAKAGLPPEAYLKIQFTQENGLPHLILDHAGTYTGQKGFYQVDKAGKATFKIADKNDPLNLPERQMPSIQDLVAASQAKKQQLGIGSSPTQTIEEQLNNLPPLKARTRPGSYSNVPEINNPLLGTTEPLPWESETTFMNRMKANSKRSIDSESLPQYSQADMLAQGGQAQINAIHKSDKFNELFAHWIGKRDAARTMGTEIGAKFKDIPTSEGRTVINALESGNENKYVKPLHDEFNKLFRYATDNGIDIGFRENYITHIWDKADSEVKQAYQVFKQREGFQNDRVVPTYAEGIRMGLTPKFENPAQIITQYAKKMEQLKANLFFFKQLKDEGLIVDASIGARQPGFTALSGSGFPRSISKSYDGKVYIGNYYAPEAIAGKINKIFTPQESNPILSVAHKISSIAQDVTLSGGIPKTPLNAFTVAQAQKELLAGRITSPIVSFVRSMSSKSSLKFFEENSGQIRKMQEQNIPITSSFDINNLLDDPGIRRPLGEKISHIWNDAVNDPTFKKFMPMLQVNLFNDIEKQARKGGKSEEEAALIAGKAVKQFYGVTGSDKEALRGQLGKDISGTFFFAPKFRESMVNFWINNIKALGNPLALENRTNVKFMAGSILTLGAMNYLNKQMTGHYMWENPSGKQDKLLIPLGNGDVAGIPFLSSIATIPRAIVREAGMVAGGDITGAANDAGSTYTSVITKPLFDIARNSDYFGKEIVSSNDITQEKFGKIGSYLLSQYLSHPYIKELTDPRNTQDPMYQRISRALELPIRFYSQKSIDSAPYFAARDEAYKNLDKTQQAAFDAIPQQDPQDPLAKQFKYITMLQYPQVYNAKKEIALRSNEAVDPLYTAPSDAVRVYMLYEAQNPGSQDKKDLYKAHPEIGQLAAARAEFFTAHPIPGEQTNNTPRPSLYVQQQMDAKNWSDPQVRAYLDANTAYNNDLRSKLGLTPLAGFTQYAKKPRKVSFGKLAFKAPKTSGLQTSRLKKPVLKLTKNTFKVSKPKKLATFRLKKNSASLSRMNSLRDIKGLTGGLFA